MKVCVLLEIDSDDPRLRPETLTALLFALGLNAWIGVSLLAAVFYHAKQIARLRRLNCAMLIIVTGAWHMRSLPVELLVRAFITERDV